MGRSKKKDPATRAAELREQAKEVAGHSGEALKNFAETTGSAAKDFATVARDAAKELVDAIEKAGKKIEPHPKRRGRKLVRNTIVLGTGIAILTNDRVRRTISSAVKRSSSTNEPAVWRPEPTTTSGNGDVRESTATTQI
jgi:ABC-type nitrate/sulfonate/bicarbonate transport system substrate-binding protein